MLIVVVFSILVIIYFDYSFSRLKEKNLSSPSVSCITSQFKASYKYPVESKKLKHYYIHPLSFTKIKKNVYRYDFGEVNFGSLKINIHDSARNKIKVKLLEREEVALNERTRYSLGYYKGEFHNIKGSLIIKLPVRHLPKPSDLPLNIKGVIPFRYVILETSVPISKIAIRQIAVRYPFSHKTTSFKSSNEILNKLWKLSKHTIMATSFAGIYVDGNRERLPYDADSYLNQISHYAIDHDYLLARKTILFLIENPSWPIEWSFALISMVYEDFMYTGDKNFLSAIYSKLQERLFIKDIDTNGFLMVSSKSGEYKLKINNLILKPLIDWPEYERRDFSKVSVTKSMYISIYFEIFTRKIRRAIYEAYGFNLLSYEQMIKIKFLYNKLTLISPENTVIYSYHFDALKKMAWLSKQLNLIDNVNQYNFIAEKLKDTLNKSFFNFNEALYNDVINKEKTSFHSNLFSLVFDLPSNSRKKHIVNYLVQNKYRASVFTAHYLLQALFDNNRSQDAINYMVQANPRSWYAMLKQHKATLTMEAWNSAIKPNLDWSHPWGATPAYHIIRNIVGVRALCPGYKCILIEPHIANLTWINSSINTPVGTVNFKFAKHRNFDRYWLLIPKGTNDNKILLTIRASRKLLSIVVNGKVQKKIVINNRFVKVVSSRGKSTLIQMNYV